MSSNLPQDVIDSIREALFAGQKIKAIKLYREATGQGLKEAKEFIEALGERLYVEDPEKFASPPGKGCAGTVLVMIVTGVVAMCSRWITS